MYTEALCYPSDGGPAKERGWCMMLDGEPTCDRRPPFDADQVRFSRFSSWPEGGPQAEDHRPVYVRLAQNERQRTRDHVNRSDKCLRAERHQRHFRNKAPCIDLSVCYVDQLEDKQSLILKMLNRCIWPRMLLRPA
jgi:hypothetical protein